jgi:hypothetical protein
MNHHRTLNIVRLVLELVLAIPGCEAAFADDAGTPPAMNCHLVRVPHAAPMGGGAPEDADDGEHLARHSAPAAIVHPLLDCRLREPATEPAAARRADGGSASADVAAR